MTQSFMKYDSPVVFSMHKGFFIFLFVSLVPLIEHNVLVESLGIIEV